LCIGPASRGPLRKMRGAGTMSLLQAEAPDPGKVAGKVAASVPPSWGSFAHLGGGGDGKTHLELPSAVKVLDETGKAKDVAVEGASQVAACCGIAPPPMGWYGPFGFFRLVSYAFMAASVSGLFLAVGSLSQMDSLGFFAGLLLIIAAAVCSMAAYSHEGLANEVTQAAEQNKKFAEKNDRMAKQLDGFGDVADKLGSLEKELGVNMDQFTGFLDSLHRQTSIQQLATLLRAFCDADRHGGAPPDERLMKGEVEEFLDDSDPVLRGACPAFDFDAFKKAAVEVGIGMHAVRFMADALIAAGSDSVHKSTALLSLIMFSFQPEEQIEHLLSELKLACPEQDPAALRVLLVQKKEKCALKDQGGHIPCRDLQDISVMIRTSVETKAAEAEVGQAAGLE